jgi:glyoxalase family protein
MLKVTGLHHVTAICSDMRKTVKFYTELLGLKLIKQTVNFDDPGTKHFYFADEMGNPGSVITFFEYPDWQGGRLGAGFTHHIAFQVENEEDQLALKKKLETEGINVTEQIDRKYFKSIYFRDPDGLILEIATKGPGFTADEPLDKLGERFIKPDTNVVRKPGYNYKR